MGGWWSPGLEEEIAALTLALRASAGKNAVLRRGAGFDTFVLNQRATPRNDIIK
jgi:hypothetical protein